MLLSYYNFKALVLRSALRHSRKTGNTKQESIIMRNIERMDYDIHHDADISEWDADFIMSILEAVKDEDKAMGKTKIVRAWADKESGEMFAMWRYQEEGETVQQVRTEIALDFLRSMPFYMCDCVEINPETFGTICE